MEILFVVMEFVEEWILQTDQKLAKRVLLIAVLVLHLCAVMDTAIDTMEKHGHLE